jgi:hypothetical protein
MPCQVEADQMANSEVKNSIVTALTRRCIPPDADGNVPMREPNVLTPEEELWKEVEDFFPGDDESIEEGPTVKADPNRMAKRREALITIVSMRALMLRSELIDGLHSAEEGRNN